MIESIKHNANIIRKCKANIKSNIKHLWKIVVNDRYTLIEQSSYDRGYWVYSYILSLIHSNKTALYKNCLLHVVNCHAKLYARILVLEHNRRILRALQHSIMDKNKTVIGWSLIAREVANSGGTIYS